MIQHIPINRSEVKSDEEWFMVLWLQEATGHELVESWSYEPRSFELFPPATYHETKQLKTKVKKVERCLHRGASYTPDFNIVFTEKGNVVFGQALKIPIQMAVDGEVYIDIKGAYNPHDQPRYFSVIQKAMYHINGIWVSRVTPFHASKGRAKGLFVDTFAPEKARWKKNGRELNRIGRECLTVSNFIKLNSDLFI